MSALLLLIATLLQPVVAPCPEGVSAYTLSEPGMVGSFCETGSEGPSVSFTDNADGTWTLDIRPTDR